MRKSMFAACAGLAILAGCAGGPSVPATGVPIAPAASNPFAVPGRPFAHAIPMRGLQRMTATPDTTATDVHNMLSYHNGWVEHTPKAFIVFWGWTSDQHQEASRLIGFLNDVGGSAWLQTVTQYYEVLQVGGDYHITNPAHILAGRWYDSRAIPSAPDAGAIANEAQNAANAFGLDASYIVFVALPQGHGGYIINNGWCGIHDRTSGGVPYAALPYGSDTIGYGCGSTEQTPNASVSVTGGHELAEAITDPADNGWYYYNSAWNRNYEIADLCADYPQTYVNLSGISFEMEPLYSDNAGQCWTTTGVGPAWYSY